MNDFAIRAENLSKIYRIGQFVGYKTLREGLVSAFSAPFRHFHSAVAEPRPQSRNPDSEYIWALKDVSFEIKPGEAVGIIGRNGAGKTTLLKVLTRITMPTEGYAEIRGRVGSLLEVGTGFHPELAGRENVYLNGAVLGMKKKEIDRKFDEIVEFAGVQKFIDTPLKRYSTGMQVRLAFSVAAHLEPEILLVDEVLAVGDTEFQKKCLGKMEDVTQGGRTVLFVSHNMGMIATLCEKAILLNQGSVEFIGPTHQAISTYLANLGADAGTKKEWSFDEAPAGENVKLKAIGITDGQGTEKQHFSTTEPVFVTIDYWVLGDDAPVNVSYSLFDENNNLIFSVINNKETSTKPINKRGLYSSKCTIPGNLLNSGKHTLNVGVFRNAMEVDVSLHHCVAFETVDDQRVHSAYSSWPGIIKPDFDWKSQRIGDV